MARPIYAINLTASGVSIDDMSGLYIGAFDTVDLRDFFSIDQIDQSEDLFTAISGGLIVLNDGVGNLTLEESQNLSTVPTFYDVPETFLDLNDTPTTYSGYGSALAVIKITEDRLIFDTTLSGIQASDPINPEDIVNKSYVDDIVSGFDISIEHNDALIASGVNIINFEGEVGVIDEGLGKVTVTVSGDQDCCCPFGPEVRWYQGEEYVTVHVLAEVKATGGPPFTISSRNGLLPRWGVGDDIFDTFCIESTVYFTPGTWYWASVDHKAYSGGAGVSGDSISDVTEWIYDQWRNGNPSGWSVSDVKKSIWAAEEETGGDTSKDPYQEAITYFGYSVPADFGTAAHTMALNLWKNPVCISGSWYEVEDVQTQLISVDCCAEDDHGSLSGLEDDDHLQYVLVDGTRGFTGTVSGIDPTQSYHLSTKEYVDTQLATKDNYNYWTFAVDGVTKDNITSTDILDFVSGDNITITRSADDQITISGSGGTTDHGNLEGLSDDDHPQYHNNTRGDARYYTQTQLDSGQLDNRYYTQTQVDSISGSLQSNIDALTHDGFADFVANEHVDHSTVSITGAGDLLTGQGGDITSSRTFTLSNSDIDHDQLTNYSADEHFTEASIDHGSISGLGDDDHTQYVPTDGSRGFTDTVSGVYPTEDYHLTTKEYVDDSVSTLSGAIEVGDLPCLQIRRTTDYTFNTSWEDITFDTTDIENKPTVLEHDNTNTDRILIKEDGFYKITYTMPINPLALAEFRARYRKNDTTVMSGSYMWVKDSNDVDELSNDFIYELSAGDFITLQLDSDCDPGDGYAKADIIVTVIKLQGMKGDKGDTGAGSNIILKEGGTNVDNTPHDTLNFVGDGVDVSDNGDGSATITISGSTNVFGSEFQQTSSEGQSSTTSSNWQQKLRLTTNSLPSGTYRIGFYADTDHSHWYSTPHVRCQLNDSDTLAINEDTLGGASFGGMAYRSLSGVDTIDIDYNNGGRGTAYIKNARIEIWRVS